MRVTGGTLAVESTYYIKRAADRELLTILGAGGYCYILDSRQIGKSSLMIRAEDELARIGVRTSFVDMSKCGRNVTAAQWYDAQLNKIGRDLGLRREIDEVWKQSADRFSPIERWARAIEQAILPRIETRLVIFVDEIDFVRSLGNQFNTDEYFATIRAFFNERSRNSELNKLSFCLAGVATPSDLIQDSKTTPYNVGTRVELKDFTREDAAAFGAEFGRSAELNRVLMSRVYYWTSGHPYLTARLADAVRMRLTNPAAAPNAEVVDAACDELFLKAGAQTKDDNLAFVSDRVLEDGEERAAVLDLYQTLRGGFLRRPRSVVYEDSDRVHSTLRLAGIVRVEHGRLHSRNRIYRRVFNGPWIRKNMPGAEIRRQRRAFWRAFALATGVASLFVLIFLYFSEQKKQRDLEIAEAKTEQVKAEFQRQVEEARRKEAETRAQSADASFVAEHKSRDQIESIRLASTSELSVSASQKQLVYSLGQSLKAMELTPTPAAIAPISRAVSLLPPLSRVFTGGGRVTSIVFDPTKKSRYVAASIGNDVHLWDLMTGVEVQRLSFGGLVYRAAFSPDGQQLAAVGDDGYIKLYEVGKTVKALPKANRAVYRVCYSPDGTRIATADAGGKVNLWTRDGSLVKAWQGNGPALDVVFSHDDEYLAAGGLDGTVSVVRLNGYTLAWTKKLPSAVISLSSDPSGRRLALATARNGAFIYDMANGDQLAKADSGAVTVALFSPDGNYLASAGGDNVIRLWEASTGRSVAEMQHTGTVYSLSFSPRGDCLSAASTEQAARVWSVPGGVEQAYLPRTSEARIAAMSPDDESVAIGDADGTVTLWKIRKRAALIRLPVDDRITALAMTPDEHYLLTAGRVSHVSLAGTVRIWLSRNGEIGPELPTFASEPEVKHVSFNPEETRFVTSGSENWASVWEAETGVRLARLEHAGQVLQAEFSRQGDLIGTAGSDNIARIWSSRTFKELASLPHPDSVRWISFSPDGRYAVTASRSGSAYLWNASDGTKLKELPAGTIAETCEQAIFSPNGNLVATIAGNSGKVFDTRSFALVKKLPHRDSVTQIAFSPRGDYIATLGQDKVVKLWAAPDWRDYATITHRDEANTVAFSPDGEYVATGGQDGVVRLMQLHRKRQRQFENRAPVTSVAFSADGDRLYTGTKDGISSTWWLGSETETKPLRTEDLGAAINDIQVSPRERYVAIATAARDPDNFGNRILIWDTANNGSVKYRPPVILNAPHDQLSGLFVSPSSRYVVSCGNQNQARLWDLATRRQVALLPHDSRVTSAAFSPDSLHVLTGSQDGTTKLWSVADPSLVERTFRSDDLDGPTSVREVQFRWAFRQIVTRTENQMIFWDLATGARLYSVRLKSDEPIQLMALSPDGRFAAIGGGQSSYTAQVFAIDRHSAAPRVTLAYKDAVRALGFSSDNRWFAAGSEDATFAVYDLQTPGAHPRRIAAAGAVNGLHFRPGDTSWILIQVPDRIQIFELGQDQEVIPMGSDFHLESAAFSPRGDYVISAARNGGAWLIPLDLNYVRKAGCAAFRNIGSPLASAFCQ